MMAASLLAASLAAGAAAALLPHPMRPAAGAPGLYCNYVWPSDAGTSVDMEVEHTWTTIPKASSTDRRGRDRDHGRDRGDRGDRERGRDRDRNKRRRSESPRRRRADEDEQQRPAAAAAAAVPAASSAASAASAAAAAASDASSQAPRSEPMDLEALVKKRDAQIAEQNKPVRPLLDHIFLRSQSR